MGSYNNRNKGTGLVNPRVAATIKVKIEGVVCIVIVSCGNSSAHGIYLNHINRLVVRNSHLYGSQSTSQENFGVYAATPIGELPSQTQQLRDTVR